MSTASEQLDANERQLRLARRIAAVIGSAVVLIFMVAGFMAYIHFSTARPAKEYFGFESGVGPRE